MPKTGEPTRQQTEGSLRRKFGYLVENLTDAEVQHLQDHWSQIESVLRETVRVAGVIRVTRPVHDAAGWHEEKCGLWKSPRK